MTLRNDWSRRLTWGLTGLVVLLAAGLGWSLLRWRQAERQMELAQQQHALAAAEAQRALESNGEQPRIRILGPAETKALLGLPMSGGPGVPAHIDAGMLIDGAERNSKRSIKKVEPLERAKVIDEGTLFDGK